MNKIFLLGASGQLGKEWQAFFAGRDDDFLLIPFTSSQMDITDNETLIHELDEHKPDLIINCAAYTKVDKAEEQKAKAKAVNAHAVKQLAHKCRDREIKLVHFSTDYIFAGTKEDQPRFPEGYPEDHQANPINIYGHTKWEGEQAIRSSGCEHLIMRVSWLCGAYGNNFVTTMLRLAEENSELSIVDDQIGSPTFTDNLVENTWQLIEEKKSGTYHLTSEGMISWADFAAGIFDITDSNVKIKKVSSDEYHTAAERPHFSKLNCDKIRNVDGIRIEHWKTGLQRMLEKLN